MVRDELARGAALLEAAGCDTPRLDAELLLAEAMGVTRAALVTSARDELQPPALAAYDELLSRREQREPVAYILGRRDFRRLTLHVDARVLVPRPETELLVEVGLSLPHEARVADVGTGSGAVALALKDERPDLIVSGIDIDADSLDVARRSGRQLGLEVEWFLGDLLGEQVFDAVVANLPYIADGTPLPPEIASYEPAGALFAGTDGLDVIRRLIALVAGRSSIRLLALEHGFDQADAVERLVAGVGGFSSVERLRDLAGHERVTVGRR